MPGESNSGDGGSVIVVEIIVEIVLFQSIWFVS